MLSQDCEPESTKGDIGFAVQDARNPQKRFLPNRDAPADSPQAK
ncbi:hypothetical protein [Microcoleus sp.]